MMNSSKWAGKSISEGVRLSHPLFFHTWSLQKSLVPLSLNSIQFPVSSLVTLSSVIWRGFFTVFLKNQSLVALRCCVTFCYTAEWISCTYMVCVFVCVLVAQLCPTLCDLMDCVACQAPLSMGFSRQNYWSGLPFPSPGDLPNLGVKLESSALQADSMPSEPPGKPHTYT